MLTPRQLWGLVALTLMWGVNWPMMKYSLRELSPLYFRALTMTGGALWLYAFFRAPGVRMTPKRAEWRQIAVLALPNMLGWHLLSIFGVKALASGRAAILGFTMPVWTVLIGALFFGERLTRRVVFATVAVALAIALLLWHEAAALAGRPVGVLWMEGAALAWAIGTLMMRRSHPSLPVQAMTVWMMLLSAAVIWLLAISLEPWPRWHFSAPMWASLAYGVLINYGFAQIIWFGLARHLPPATSAMSIMAVPLIGTASATLIVGEWPSWQDGAALIAVMAAMAAVLLPPRTAARPAPPKETA
ncbi:MAG: EamA family transporter [Tibeticola sp.]